MSFDAQPAVVRQVDELHWATMAPLRYTATRQTFLVEVGSPTDFASVPRPLAWLVPRTGNSVRPAILHDTLWRSHAPAGEIAYREADAIFRQALRREGVSFVLRWLCWTAVRWASLLTRRGGRVGWWRDAPLVIVWTLLALPWVAPPAMLVAAALLVLAVAEGLCWFPLLLFSRRKQVNPPAVSART